MKWLLGFAAAVLLAGIARADYSPGFTIPSGPGLQRLAQLCDWLRADPTINKPAMSDDECAERFFKRGAFDFNHEKKRQELQSVGNTQLATEDENFWVDLPMPANGDPPTPTATPTATSTATPTGTPTATPTATP